MKKILLGFLLCLVSAVAMAVPAKPGLWKILKLSDGTEVRAQLRGDEYVHFWMTEDGRRLMKLDGVLTEVDETQIAGRMAKRKAPQSPSGARKAPRRVTPGERTHYVGKKKGLVILAQYQDVKFQSANNLAKYKRIMNEEGYSVGKFKGSVCDYFKAQSRGVFELDFDVVGPYTLANKRAYYGENDSEGEDKNAEAMIVEACKAANEEVNFKDYDWDGDGEVDQVFVLYAGTGEADSYDEESVWPHMYELSYTKSALRLDGVKIDTYACSNEVDMKGDIEGIGCFCHEFSHCLGFPDFYDVSYSGYFGMSDFDLMDSGVYNGEGFVPAGYTAHELMMCGWLDPIELSDEDVSVENMKALSDGGESYIIYNKAHPDEYYMLENRQKTGWDAGLQTRGLMITHVDFDKDIWNDNTPNTKVTAADKRRYGYTKTNDHQRCTIFHADNDDDSKYWKYIDDYGQYYYTKKTLTGDLYPYLSNDSLTNTSVPAATLYNRNTDDTKLMNRRVLEIKQNTDKTMSFLFKATATDNEDGIESIQDSKLKIQNGVGKVYDLSGRSVDDSQSIKKGIYIVNGRKRVVR